MRRVPRRFFKFSIILCQNLHCNLLLLSNFRKLYHAHAERRGKHFYHTLSKRGNDFIAHWAYAERIFAYAQPAGNAGHMRKWFHRTLIIRGNDINAGWAYAEMISSLTAHTRKCLKVQYLVLQALGTIRILQKKSQKMSCLCTFNVADGMTLCPRTMCPSSFVVGWCVSWTTRHAP